MGHVQDPAVSTNMILIVCMIYHMKVHMFGYNLGPQKMSKSKIHILTISEPISMKPAIVNMEFRNFLDFQTNRALESAVFIANLAFICQAVQSRPMGPKLGIWV